MTRDPIDLHAVKFAHEAIHERLLNWSRWCRDSGRASAMHPMFHGYQGGRNRETTVSIPVDTIDGHLIEKLVVALPEKPRALLQWWYCKPYIPVRRVRSALGLSYTALGEEIHTARTMLKNTAAAKPIARSAAFC